MPRILFPQWRREHSTSRYPFGDRSDLTNAEGYTILDGTFCDAALYPIGAAAGLYLARVTVDHQAVTLAVGDATTTEVATGSFPLFAPPTAVDLVDAYGRPAGVLVSEPAVLGAFQAWEVGDHLFTQLQTQFAASVCFPTPEAGVRGVLLDDGTLLTGDVWLVGDDGVVVREESVVVDQGCRTQPYSVVRVDVVGDPLFRRRLCQPISLFTTPAFVRTVLVKHPGGQFVCAPDAAGNLQVTVGNGTTADTVIRIATAATGITFSAVGSKL